MNKSYYNAESNLIAKRLRQLRKERGFSQEELAAQLQLLGVDINPVSYTHLTLPTT